MIVRVDIPDLKKVEQLIGMTTNKAPMALRATLNETAKRTQKLIAQRASKRYANHKQKDYTDASKITKATVANLCAKLTYRGDNGELYDFSLSDKTYYPASRGGPKQLKGKVVRSNSLEKLKLNMSGRDKYKAFVASYKAGEKRHITVAQRVPGKRMKSNPKKEALKTLFAPSFPTMATSENGIWDDSLMDELQSVVNVAMVKQIEKFMQVRVKK